MRNILFLETILFILIGKERDKRYTERDKRIRIGRKEIE